MCGVPAGRMLAPMTLNRSISSLAAAAAIPLAALAVAGCGGGGGDATAAPAPPKTAGGEPATVGVASTGLGKVLVDSNGRTIYLFKKDSGTKSACSGACATEWPPVRASGKPTVGGGATPSLVSTTKRSDGKPQVTYNGHPLYLFEGDHNPGDTSGQGLTAFGAAWYALSPAGNQVSGAASSSGGGSNYGSGSGY
jgi:predicted lipoprotein with Yx(FWY)xxD motif